MIQILTIIAPLFLIIFVSALLQKFKNVGDKWGKVLNEFALKVGLPVLIFTALAKTSFSFKAESSLIIVNSLFLLLSFVLAVFIGKILRLKKKMFLTLFICFIFGNVAYLGIPVLTSVSGESILPKVSLIIAIYLFWIFTIGIGYLDYSVNKNKKDVVKNMLKNLTKNPLLLAVIFGLIFGSLKIAIPSIILKSLEMVSVSVTPIVLVVIGLFIGNSKIGKLSEWLPVILFSLFTLIVFPASFYFGAKFFGFVPSQFMSSIIEAAMPLAITPFALADKYNLHKNFITRSIVLSTILSVISLPFWISLIG
ncbi:MAG: AEC family transporter [Candidatus Magasanikbacteria bacterium]|jgi:predicted permease|nr:AEC family transporter [Candidatus Magasanikbacteria bacterium]MBT4221121.1 AEC family transporter [Candidatus Magasanikbacteria bacterium]MBT4350309.1 AEC family transporter [Candidatus Magasanikbacteria bacterium]MBT4541735.1 AEC family transporter [Candidatus Magasanikbacteria bacterium]MBT6253288.1 AEC family transporter [Candidatus Magasanikbacteria bacterium]